MKPIHEQEWERVGAHVECETGVVTINTGGRHPAHKELELISAAPEMARALISVLYRQGDADSREKMARAALIKAGVIPTQLPVSPPDNQS